MCTEESKGQMCATQLKSTRALRDTQSAAGRLYSSDFLVLSAVGSTDPSGLATEGPHVQMVKSEKHVCRARSARKGCMVQRTSACARELRVYTTRSTQHYITTLHYTMLGCDSLFRVLMICLMTWATLAPNPAGSKGCTRLPTAFAHPPHWLTACKNTACRSAVQLNAGSLLFEIAGLCALPSGLKC